MYLFFMCSVLFYMYIIHFDDEYMIVLLSRLFDIKFIHLFTSQLLMTFKKRREIVVLLLFFSILSTCCCSAAETRSKVCGCGKFTTIHYFWFVILSRLDKCILVVWEHLHLSFMNHESTWGMQCTHLPVI